MGGIMDLLMIAVVIGGGIYVIKNVLPGLIPQPAAGGSTDTTNVTNVTSCSPTCVNQGNQICCSGNDVNGSAHTRCALNQADASNLLCNTIAQNQAVNKPTGSGKASNCKPKNSKGQYCADGVDVHGATHEKCANSCKSAQKLVDQVVSQSGGYATGYADWLGGSSRPSKKHCKHGQKCITTDANTYSGPGGTGVYTGHDPRSVGKTKSQIGVDTMKALCATMDPPQCACTGSGSTGGCCPC